MKRNYIYVICLLLAACSGSDEKAKPVVVPQGPLAQSANSDAFNQSFEKLMTDYYALKDAFIAEKKEVVTQSAKDMLMASDSLLLGELKADTSLVATAQTYTIGISAELKGLLGEPGMDQRRKSFQLISDQLYDLIRTVQYDQAVVYHDFCPMAFNDQGANWLSREAVIRNPYMPKKMLTCGEVKDSIDFRPR